MTKTELRATRLLETYDKKRRELRELERELHQACVEYGREQGYIGWYNKDSFRTHVNAKRQRLEQEQEQEQLRCKAGAA
jgi:hypothetical protein